LTGGGVEEEWRRSGGGVERTTREDDLRGERVVDEERRTTGEEAEERRDREIEKTFAKEDYRQKIDQRLIEHKFANNPDLKFDDPNYYTSAKKLEQLRDH